MEYVIKLNRDEEEEFESEGKNVADLRVFKEGQDITKGSRVILSLSREGMLGLGTELIRLAMQFEDGVHYHIDPSRSDFMSQVLGVYLTPESCELVVCCSDLGVIDDYIKKSK